MITIKPKYKNKKKQIIKVRVFYPETPEGMNQLKTIQARLVLDILEKKLGAEKLDQLIEYMKSKLNKG